MKERERERALRVDSFGVPMSQTLHGTAIFVPMLTPFQPHGINGIYDMAYMECLGVDVMTCTSR